jgi:hypothetical protein
MKTNSEITLGFEKTATSFRSFSPDDIGNLSENIDKLQSGDLIKYSTKTGTTVFGSIWNYKNSGNFEFLPINDDFLNLLDRYNVDDIKLVIDNNFEGKVEKVDLTFKDIAKWKLGTARKYETESRPYEFIVSIMDRYVDLKAGKKTKKLPKIINRFKNIKISKDEQLDAKIVDLKKYSESKKLTNAENKVDQLTTTKEEINILPEVDGYKFNDTIYYYDKVENEIKTGYFICKSLLNNTYTVDKGELSGSVTKKRMVETLPCEMVSKVEMDLEKYIILDTTKIVGKKVNIQAQVRKIKSSIIIEPKQQSAEKLSRLFDDTIFDENFSSKTEYDKLSKLIEDKENSELFFEQCHQLLGEFRHSSTFEFTVNEEIVKLEEVKQEINKLDFKKDSKKLSYLFNQLLKLKWIVKFNEDFKESFPDEDMLGGISTEIRKKCAQLFNQKIHGSVDAKTAIDYWAKNKNWLMNQVQMIKQANSINNTEKKSFWQKGLSKVKSWFGR